MTHGGTHAIILSGGGAKGAFEIGVLKALLPGRVRTLGEGVEIHPVVYTGTSVGSFNAAFMTSRPGQAPVDTLAELEFLWRNRIAGTSTRPNGVLRLRANPLELLNVGRVLADPLAPPRDFIEDGAFFAKLALERAGGFLKSSNPLMERLADLVDFSALVSTTGMHDLVRETIDIERIRTNSAQALIVAATNWDEGEVRLFGNRDASGELAGISSIDEKNGHLAILASMAIPGVFPPVEIDQTNYVDGGLLLNTPLAPALHALRSVAPGRDEYVVHVVYLDPDLKDVPVDQQPGTLDTLNRLNALAFASQVNRDVKQARFINQSIELLRADGGFGPAAASFKAQVRDVHRPITIHRYHPSSLLGGVFGLLSFDSGYIDKLIALGFEEAVTHDCARSGCIFPTFEQAQVAKAASALPSA